VVAVVGVLAAVLLAVAAVLGLSTWSWSQVRERDQAQEASRTAPAAAERAAAAVLSYDYRSLGADEKAAARYLTPVFREKYLSSMALVRPNAPKLRARVQASVKASGVANADPDRVDVLVYVDQTTSSTANGGQPQLALNRAKFSMVRRGSTWLVDDITSY
jgi:Mce-associated membrane protein